MATDVIIPASDQIKESVEHLKEWISKEPHLPNIGDKKWLETFLYQNKFSLEKTKLKLENYYSLRSKYPEFLKNRDPTAPDIQECRKYVKIAVSDKLLEDKNTWLVFLKFEDDPNGFDATVYVKRALMIMDLILLKQQNRIADLIMISDLQDFRYLHGLKYMKVATQMNEIFYKAYTARTKAMHMINVPTIAQSFLELISKLTPKKFNERWHMHSAAKSTFLEMVDAENVCTDFGGGGPTLTVLEEQTQQELEKYRKWFEEQESVCSDENLRRKDFDQIEKMKGSFRKLEVD